MLVVTRKSEQMIVIGNSPELKDNIVIKVKIVRDQVRVYVAAPKATKVHRLEVWVDIQKKLEEEANGG